MSRFNLGLEGQEQDLELDLMEQRDDVETQSFADSPFSPTASAAFATTVNDAETLGKMNNVLENVNTDEIPATSRAAIQTAMESIRGRLLGGSKAKGVAIEGFDTKADLQVAIEDNRNIIQRAWDAIVKFFKGIYDWIRNLFSKKKDVAEANRQKIDELERAAKEAESIEQMVKSLLINVDFNKAAANQEELAKTVKNSKNLSKVHSKGIKPRFKNGEPIADVESRSVSTEDLKDRDTRIKALMAILTGVDPILLVTDEFSLLFGEKDFSNKITGLSDMINVDKKLIEAHGVFDKSGYGNLFDKTPSKELFASLKTITLEELFGSDLQLTLGTSINFAGNNCKVVKAENKEINILVSGTIKDSKNALQGLRNLVKELSTETIEIYETVEKVTANFISFGEKAEKESSDDPSKKEEVDAIKEKIGIINALIKFLLMVVNECDNVSRKSITFLETYLASVHLVMREMSKK